MIIVVLGTAGYIFGSLWAGVEISFGFLISSIMVAAVSWLDDIRSLSVVIRFLVHAIAAAFVIFDIGYWHVITITAVPGSFDLGFFGSLVSGLWIVWMINAYNFMDGIDGIAGSQAVVSGLGWATIAYLAGTVEIAIFASVLVGAALGFLWHNWQPAKIFMGDVGSAYLGFVFAVIPILFIGKSNDIDAYIPLIAVALLWLFVFDTIWTFLRRLLRGERVWTAHREHLYQQLVRSGWQHRSVTVLYSILAGIIALITVWATSAATTRFWFAALSIAAVSVGILILVERKKRLT
ncbi:MAG: glycosyltransferase family 4 protein [Pyrinomonadaceae bacterium]|nr:glycosyltransferase family 4 protein [Pyrinomonadaceae bacterium]